MSAGLAVYSHTKKSGVRWIGDIPAHWEVRGLGQLGRFSKGSGGTKEDEVSDGIPCIRYGDLYARYGSYITSAASFVAPKRVIDYTPIFFGDVLFAGSGETLDEIGKSAVNLLEDRACCGGDILIFRARGTINPRFLGYAADCPASVHQKACMGRGVTVMHIYGDDLKYLRIAIPPLTEQEGIVRFLDHAGRRIRRAIRAKQELIALLDEQKRTLIQRLLMDGGWDVISLRYVATKFGSGITPRGGAAVYQSAGVSFLRSQNIHFDGLRLEGVARIPYELHERLSATHVLPGDVLLNITGASIGRVCFVPDEMDEANVNQHVCIIRPKKSRILPGLLAAYLSTPFMQAEIRLEQKGASREGLTLDSIRSFKILLPPLSEQKTILDRIHRRTADIASVSQAARREIDVLREYRNRLIADVVTGKLDVREAAARLPDETEEAEPLDEVGLEQPADAADEALERVEA